MNFRDPKVPVYANASAKAVTKAEKLRVFGQQLTSPVRAGPTVVAMQAAGINEFLELGPGKTPAG